MSIRKMDIRLRGTYGGGLFHNSREDCVILAKACNELIDKVNELVNEVNDLEKDIEELKK